MNFTITRYQLDADMTPGKRFVRERRDGHRLWFVRIGQYGHSLRIWR